MPEGISPPRVRKTPYAQTPMTFVTLKAISHAPSMLFFCVCLGDPLLARSVRKKMRCSDENISSPPFHLPFQES